MSPCLLQDRVCGRRPPSSPPPAFKNQLILVPASSDWDQGETWVYAVLSLLSLTHVLSGLSLSFCRSIWKASLCRSCITSVNQFLSLQENAVAVKPGYCLNCLWSQHQPRDAPLGKSGGTFLEKQREDPQRVGSTFQQGPGHKEI